MAPSIGSACARGWRAWSGERPARWSRLLVVAGAALLVLDSTATVDVGFTVNLSYGLLAAACALAAPVIPRGYARLPVIVRWAAAALFLSYAAAWVLGSPVQIEGFSRSGPARGAAYVADLGLGLGILGLMAGLWAEARPHGLMLAAAVGACVAGTYGVYQWFALRYSLPFADVNTTLASNGLQGSSQGAGLFGGERIRGTFLEPHFFAAYLGSMLPVTLVASLRQSGRRRAALWAGLAMMVVALGLTISGPGWAIVILMAPVGALLYAIGRGWRVPAAIVAGLTVGIWIAVAPVLTSPQLLAPVLGRSATDLSYSTSYRTETWRSAVSLWEQAPVLGTGPGQSAVRLTRVGLESAGISKTRVLISAQGVWAAALLDGGVIACTLLLLLLGALVVAAGGTLMRAPSLWRAATVVSGSVVVAQVMISGDRLFARHWVVLGLMAATAGELRRRQGGERHERSPA